MKNNYGWCVLPTPPVAVKEPPQTSRNRHKPLSYRQIFPVQEIMYPKPLILSNELAKNGLQKPRDGSIRSIYISSIIYAWLEGPAAARLLAEGLGSSRARSTRENWSEIAAILFYETISAKTGYKTNCIDRVLVLSKILFLGPSHSLLLKIKTIISFL